MQTQAELPMERRARSRFPLRLGVRYRSLAGEPALLGAGRTLNVSSCGLLIEPEDEARVDAGSRLQLIVDWPFLLHGVTPLQLIVACRVTRSVPEEFAVKLEQYQFRTKKRFDA